jgi:hypothetical protein
VGTSGSDVEFHFGYTEQEEEDSLYSVFQDSLYQQSGLKFEEETSKILHLEHSFVWR